MKASIRFREDQKPLLRAKIPLNILNFPFQSGVVAGESKELSLNLSTFFDSGPTLKFSYRPNDSLNPFSLVCKTGIGPFGSPAKSPLTMSAEFKLVGSNQNPSFFIHLKPNFGDFSLKKSHSSVSIQGLGEKLNGGVLKGEGFVDNAYFKRNGFLSGAAESKAAAGVVEGLVRGTEVSAATSVPVNGVAKLNFRWGLRFPAAEMGEMDAVMVAKRNDRTAGIRLPLLVMNKIGIEHVLKVDTKKDNVVSKEADVALDVKRQLEDIRSENGLLRKALDDLRSEIAAGRMNLALTNDGKKFSGRVDSWSNNGDKKSSEASDELKKALKAA